MTTSEERMRILRLIEEGKVSPEEGARLLGAVGSAEPGGDREPLAAAESGQRWLKVRVTDMYTGRPRVNVNLPLSVARAVARLVARLVPEAAGVNLHEVQEAVESGFTGKIVEVEDEDGGERVEIVIE